MDFALDINFLWSKHFFQKLLNEAVILNIGVRFSRDSPL